MNKLTLTLQREVMARLRDEAARQNIPVEEVARRLIEEHFGFDDDDEPTKEEILEDIRQSMLDALAGRTRPFDEVLAELKEEFDFDGDET
jgi:O-methyltransferase involved in polyketide biosynthesis